MKRVNRYYDAAKAHHTPEGFRNRNLRSARRVTCSVGRMNANGRGCPSRRSRDMRNLPNAGGNPPISAAAMTASGGWGMRQCCCGWAAVIS